MTISVTSNISEVMQIEINRMLTLAQANQMVRTIATTELALMKVRVHEQGMNSAEQQIGLYTPGYMKLRTGSYGNSQTVTRGPNKGSLKDAGVFTKGKDKGKPRPKYHRSSDPKVVASLTRQMENDEKVIPLEDNACGIGFSNSANYNKSQWVEATYQQKIFSPSATEETEIQRIVEQLTNDIITK